MEQQNIPETKTKPKTNIGSILLLIGLLLIFAGVAMTTLAPQDETEQETSTPSEETTQETTNKVGQTIELSKETEEITIDEKLRIKFIGTPSTEIDGAYKYKAEIYINNELINHNFFTGTNIYSKDYAANITIFKLQNTYIINSFVAKQCGGSDVLVITEDKTSMIPYTDVTIEINEEASNYGITKCTDCMSESSCQKTTVDVPKLTK